MEQPQQPQQHQAAPPCEARDAPKWKDLPLDVLCNILGRLASPCSGPRAAALAAPVCTNWRRAALALPLRCVVAGPHGTDAAAWSLWLRRYGPALRGLCVQPLDAPDHARVLAALQQAAAAAAASGSPLPLQALALHHVPELEDPDQPVVPPELLALLPRLRSLEGLRARLPDARAARQEATGLEGLAACAQLTRLQLRLDAGSGGGGGSAAHPPAPARWQQAWACLPTRLQRLDLELSCTCSPCAWPAQLSLLACLRDLRVTLPDGQPPDGWLAHAAQQDHQPPLPPPRQPQQQQQEQQQRLVHLRMIPAPLQRADLPPALTSLHLDGLAVDACARLLPVAGLVRGLRLLPSRSGREAWPGHSIAALRQLTAVTRLHVCTHAWRPAFSDLPALAEATWQLPGGKAASGCDALQQPAALPALRSLRLDSWPRSCCAAAAPAAVHLQQLTRLELRGRMSSSALVAWMAAAPQLQGLRALAIELMALMPHHWVSRLTRLTELTVSCELHGRHGGEKGGALLPAAMGGIAAAPALRALVLVHHGCRFPPRQGRERCGAWWEAQLPGVLVDEVWCKGGALQERQLCCEYRRCEES